MGLQYPLRIHPSEQNLIHSNRRKLKPLIPSLTHPRLQKHQYRTAIHFVISKDSNIDLQVLNRKNETSSPNFTTQNQPLRRVAITIPNQEQTKQSVRYLRNSGMNKTEKRDRTV
ncbi:hypothetical protein NE237_017618 [Protea cynaroides]|uniref:Uncharacterized protein n=1 Tax=Protea cynaroides TaxID=273540 RepID=A0A9Q0K8C7_9MAGN|nr:hypothetical protein NE237_017618 [Protea cynaroides]